MGILDRFNGLFADPQIPQGGVMGEPVNPVFNPQGDARLAMASSLLSGSSPGPQYKGFGEIMGNALMAGQAARQQAQQLQMRQVALQGEEANRQAQLKVQQQNADAYQQQQQLEHAAALERARIAALPFEQQPEGMKLALENRFKLGQIDETGKQSRLTDAQKAAPVDVLGAGAPGAGNGGDYLATLPPAIGTQVKALAEGRMAFPSGMALKTPYWQQMLSAVAQYDPGFDAVNYNSRSKTRADFTSGKNAQNIKSLNTAIGHLGTLDEQISGTASHGMKAVNAVENFLGEQTGSSGPTNFKQTASALATELTAVFRGSGGAEADVKRYLDQLDVNGSAAQKKAAVNNIVDLLHSRLSAIGDQYNQGMGTTEDPITLLNPKAQAVLNRVAGGQAAPAPTGASGTWAPSVAKRAGSYY